MLQFTHLLVEQKGKYFYENEDIQRTHENLDTINCFNNIGVEYRSVFPIKIKTRPCIILLRRRTNYLPLTIEPPVKVAKMNKPNLASISNAEHLEKLQLNEIRFKNNDVDDNESLTKNDYNVDSEAIDGNQNEIDDEIEETNEYNDTDDTKHTDDEFDDTFDTLENDMNDDEQIIVENDLKRPTKETKNKLKKFIERHYQLKASKEPSNDRTEMISTNSNRPSIKSNIKHIIKKEKIKELIERISEIDLRTVCNLERQTTKQCLLKIIDSYTD